MIRYLRPPSAARTPAVQPRATRLAVIRWIYIACVLALAVWLGDILFGNLLYLQSEGLVLGEPGVVAAEFPLTVRNILVHQGETVKKGQVAAVVSSQNVTETIARLTSENAALEARGGDLRIRSAVINGLLSLAQQRQSIATNARKQLETLLAQGNLVLNQRTAAVDMEYRSYQDFEALKAEKPVVEDELRVRNNALAIAENALGDLRKLYDNGQLRIPIDGVVSRVNARHGAVTRPGDPLIELYGTERFVLGYKPTGTLYNVAAGDEVVIKVGLRSLRGTVARVEPVAAALPPEFQRAFSPVDTQQLIRVEFAPGETPPPLLTKVTLRSAYFLPNWVRRLWREW